MSFGDPAVVYLLYHHRFQALKVGIASQLSRTDRIAHHALRGWKPVATWSMPTGFHAAAVELEILNWWRNHLSAPVALTKEAMPQGGYTETVSHLYVGIAATAGKIDLAIRAARENPDAYVAAAEKTAALMDDG